MPRRNDIRKILVIGSGPIVIGQGCEFDYSGTQAIKVLREEGFEVVLVNSNPATIMTDPAVANSTYIEPLTVPFLTAVIEKERPDAVLPTMGGQTALNLALALDDEGILERYGCRLIGANATSIKTAEDRELFRRAMDEIGLRSAQSGLARSVVEAQAIAATIGYPLILRPSRTLGGTGGGIVNDHRELADKVTIALDASPNREVLVEQSLLGWKEIELEVMRDTADNVVIVCSIENFDPMGVHTGDSITVAPVQTLTDKEYQALRDAAIKIIRKIGVDTGGSNVQFALNPRTGDIIVIEMNPRVSRSSALASKATGFPIAKIAARLAVGYTLDEIRNDITRETPACFEPSIDYTVVKFPRFTFEKFAGANDTLGTQMKSVGEAMAIGRSFPEALQKAICSLEVGSCGFDGYGVSPKSSKEELLTAVARPTPQRLWQLAEAFRSGATVEELYRQSAVDPWFLRHIETIILHEKSLAAATINHLDVNNFRELKRLGFSDARLAQLLRCSEDEVREIRQNLNVRPSYKVVDTCAAEFAAFTPYLYSTYDGISEASPTNLPKVIILGSGPNRIGQGIEFDYCCVHATTALKEVDFETIMINCNPETVSTDYDVSDRLYFEPLTLEHVLEVAYRESPRGVIIQCGGQTPLKLAKRLAQANVPILGTSVASIVAAEDREQSAALVKKLGLLQPAGACATTLPQAREAAMQLGFPLMIRPSFVLGGRAMRKLHTMEQLDQYFADGVSVSHQSPVLLDTFLEDAIEVDVDCVSDGQSVVVAGVMEHIEPTGIHSGDSFCALPPFSLPRKVRQQLHSQAIAVAKTLGVIGHMNMQFAVTKDERVWVIEINPRASRTVPFVSKATGISWAKVAARCAIGERIPPELLSLPEPNHVSVKGCVYPFKKFPEHDPRLGAEMRSTGEVMGVTASFPESYRRALIAAGISLPDSGIVLLPATCSITGELQQIVNQCTELGYTVHSVATFEAHDQLFADHSIAAYLDLDSVDPRDRHVRSLCLYYQIPIIRSLRGAGILFSDLSPSSVVTSLQDWQSSPTQRSPESARVLNTAWQA